MQTLQQEWASFLDRPFPSGYAGHEVDGIDLVLLDSDAAGCIDAFVNYREQLDEKRTGILRQCVVELKEVIPQLEGEARAYFSHLLRLSAAVLERITL